VHLPIDFSHLYPISVDNPSSLGDVAATSRHQPRIRLEKKLFAFKITEI